MNQIKTFGDFLWSEIQRREMSTREFARFVGVAHNTVGKFLNYGSKNVGYPSVDFLLKVAKATGTDIGYLMILIDPDVPRIANVDPSAMIVSQQIEKLPDAYREIIDDILARHAK